MMFGLYLAVSSADVRGKRDKARELLSMGNDPSEDKRHDARSRS